MSGPVLVFDFIGVNISKRLLKALQNQQLTQRYFLEGGEYTANKYMLNRDKKYLNTNILKRNLAPKTFPKKKLIYFSTCIRLTSAPRAFVSVRKFNYTYEWSFHEISEIPRTPRNPKPGYSDKVLQLKAASGVWRKMFNEKKHQ